MAGRELGAQVAEQLNRQAHVLLDERHDGLVEDALVVELHRRDAQPLGIDLGRVRGVRAGDPAADIGVVADRAGEGETLALVKQRLEDEDVGQVHAAVERVVHDEDVAGRHVVPEVAHDRLHGGRHRAEMARQGQALGREPAVGVGEARRIVHVVLEHARIGRPEHGKRHLVGDREDRVLEQLERDRVVDLRHLRNPPVIQTRNSTHVPCRTYRIYAAATRLRGGVRIMGARSAATSDAARRSSGTAR